MNDWCSCNRLREAEAALKMACEEIADRSGACPSYAYGWEVEECAESCRNDHAECWRKALIRKARRDV